MAADKSVDGEIEKSKFRIDQHEEVMEDCGK